LRGGVNQETADGDEGHERAGGGDAQQATKMVVRLSFHGCILLKILVLE
jgi:hypothetical protein